jgi:rod shape-determining protein MreD
MIPLRYKLELTLLSALPPLTTLLLLFLSAVPTHIPGWAEVVPLLGYTSVYYWLLIAPRRMPMSFMFVVGALQDVLLGTPLGISSLLYMLFRTLVASQRRMLAREAFFVQWPYFCVYMLCITVITWGVMGLYGMALPPIAPALVQCVLTMGFYPAVHAVLFVLHHISSRKHIAALHRK